VGVEQLSRYACAEAGAVKLNDSDDSVGSLHPGEVVELTVAKPSSLTPLLNKLGRELRASPLRAVPVGRLLRDAGTQA